MQSTVLFGLIYLAIAARISVLARCAVSGLLRLYPLYAALVTLSVVRGVVSVTLPSRSYATFFNRTLWPLAILEAAAVLEAFWILARHFRRMRGFGWVLLGAVTAVSALSSLMVRLLRDNWGAMSGVYLFGMYTHIGMLLAALLSFGFFHQFRGVPIRPNARRHMLLLCLLLGCYFAANLSGQILRGKQSVAPNLILNAGAILSSLCWAITMNREGEKLPFDPPPEMSGEDFDAEESRHRKSREQLKRASDEARRKLRA